MTDQTPITIPEGFRMDAKGNLVAIANIRASDQLEDQLVEKMFGYAEPLSAQIARFKGHCFDDIAAFMAILAEKHGAKKGGRKGNVTFFSFDGCRKVTLQVAETLTFGPELQVAKQLVDECIAAWSTDTHGPIRALVNHAFQVDKAGKINSAALFQLRRVEIDDPAWKGAMTALTESIRTIGSKEYIRFYKRADHRAGWEAVTIDLASA